MKIIAISLGLILVILSSFYIILDARAPNVKYDSLTSEFINTDERTKTNFTKNYKYLGIGMTEHGPCYVYRIGFAHDTSDRVYIYRKSIFSSDGRLGFED